MEARQDRIAPVKEKSSQKKKKNPRNIMNGQETIPWSGGLLHGGDDDQMASSQKGTGSREQQSLSRGKRTDVNCHSRSPLCGGQAPC